MNTYKTAQIAKLIGVHPNTVRLYESIGFIPEVARTGNGYRVYTERHLYQGQIVRLALKVEVLQNGLRKQIIQVVKVSAEGRYDEALTLTENYIKNVRQEHDNAEEAINIVKELLAGKAETDNIFLKRYETAKLLKVTIDTLRNWELNGLLSVRRKENGYRVYSGEDINRLKIIRTLRCANYSLSSILRLMNTLDDKPDAEIKQVLNTVDGDEDIIYACDKLFVSLQDAERNGKEIVTLLRKLKTLD